MLVNLTCRYCDHKWNMRLYNRTDVRCPVCKDKSIKIIDPSEHVIDYYAVSPPFEKKKPVVETIKAPEKEDEPAQPFPYSATDSYDDDYYHF